MSVFTKDKLEKYADVMVWGLEQARKGGKINPYETLLLRYNAPAQDFADTLYRRFLEKKVNIVVRLTPGPVAEKDFFTLGDKKMLGFIPAGERELYSSANGWIRVRAPESLTHLKDTDPKKIAIPAIAGKPLRDILDRREEEGKFSWTLCTYPTEELAKQAGLSLKEYAAQIEKACFLGEKDPVARWRQVYRDCGEIKKWLNSLGIETLHLQSARCDLEVKLGESRRFLGVSGHNIPSFEIFTSPDWRGTRGTYFADFPSFRDGNYVKDIKLVFEKGRAVSVRAGKGDNFVKKTLAMDAGAGALGEFSLTDSRFSKIDRFMADTLFDENHGGKHGNCHVALGASYSDTFAGDPKKLTKAAKAKLGFNNSALHWDIINTEDKAVTAALKNGKKITVYENGEFKY
ncbi:MAG: aminopeptidase [Elusimicrobiales bacterium]